MVRPSVSWVFMLCAPSWLILAEITLFEYIFAAWFQKCMICSQRCGERSYCRRYASRSEMVFIDVLQ